MALPSDAEQALLALFDASKFEEDLDSLYPGLADPNLLPELSLWINDSIQDFLEIVRRGNVTSAELLECLRRCVARYDGRTLDTEDRERCAGYFEEIMDCVGLDSSEGILNELVYGGDIG